MNEEKQMNLFLEISEGIGKVLFFVLLFALLITILIILILALTYPFRMESCREFATQNNLQFVYRFFYGCMINYKGHWISPDNLIQLLK